jgi:hypothetical protein
VDEHTPAQGPKTCHECGEDKPRDKFPAKGRVCRACLSAKQSRRHAANREQSKAAMRGYYARNREQIRADQKANYYRNREQHLAAQRDYRQRNVEAHRQRAADWRAANPDRHVANVLAWQASNPERVAEIKRRALSRRRARIRGLPTEKYTLDELLARDGTACVLCGEELDLTAVSPDPLSLTVEHLECISWQDSAGDVRSNVAVSHRRCNVRRNVSPHPAAARKRAELLAASKATTT